MWFILILSLIYFFFHCSGSVLMHSRLLIYTHSWVASELLLHLRFHTNIARDVYRRWYVKKSRARMKHKIIIFELMMMFYGTIKPFRRQNKKTLQVSEHVTIKCRVSRKRGNKRVTGNIGQRVEERNTSQAAKQNNNKMRVTSWRRKKSIRYDDVDSPRTLHTFAVYFLFWDFLFPLLIL